MGVSDYMYRRRHATYIASVEWASAYSEYMEKECESHLFKMKLYVIKLFGRRAVSGLLSRNRLKELDGGKLFSIR